MTAAEAVTAVEGGALTVHNATVTTATVTIQTLKVGSRQVTQALFRQLRMLPSVIDVDSCTYRGTPWGWVNYHGTCNGESRFHLHVIWSWQGDLYHATELYPMYYAEEMFPERLVVLTSKWDEILFRTPQLFIAV